jgi:flavin reductase (DIM6/NTAB) family NADH-FMN oxidoreductase RutF
MAKIDVEGSKAYRLLYPRLVTLVGCCDPESGKPNAIAVAWSVPLSMVPPMVGVSIAPARYSHGLIQRAKEFTINVPPASLARKVSACGTTSGRDTDKFRSFGLTARRGRKVRAPVIEECIAHLECRLVNAVETGDHTLFIGEVLAAYVDEELFREGRMDARRFKGLYQISGTTYTTLSEEAVRD